MKRMFALGGLALPLLLAATQQAPAQSSCPFMGCGGFCFKFLGKIHQNGPLFNYGPYSGYYPFEPYGPWNSQLQYTGPYPNQNPGACGWNNGRGCSTCGGRAGAGGCSTCGGGGGWGRYAMTTHLNVRQRVLPLFHGHKGGCSTCTADVGKPTADIAAVAADSPVPPIDSPLRER